MTWRPIYKNSSLPYNEGDRFLARVNECNCGTEEINVIKCLKTRPCIKDFLTKNELSFYYILEDGRTSKHHTYTKGGVIAKHKYWKLIYPENRNDIFVCLCVNTCILKSINNDSLNDYTKLNCCHCQQLTDRCSDHCINFKRGK